MYLYFYIELTNKII